MKKLLTIILLFTIGHSLFSTNSFAQLSPTVTCWQINSTGNLGFAGIETNVQQVQYSTNNVYVSTNDIASWIPVGYNWPNNPWFPQDMSYVFKITLNPTQNTGTLIKPWFGHIGVWTNGVSIYNPMDAKTYLDSGVWYQNAVFFEHLNLETMDSCLGHPNGSHEYHLHVHPKCLWNDADSAHHAPLLGYAFDGFPIYGCYTYTNPNGTGAIKKMTSSYRLRNITDRTVLPDGATLSPVHYGPSLATYPLGAYIQDYEYVSGLGDLDEHNGRYGVTPEYPQGTYAYFVTLDDQFNPAFPYVLGLTYYGTVQPGNTGPNSGFNTVTESVTNYTGVTVVPTVEEIKFDLFPNPASDQLNFLLNTNDISQHYTGTIYNNRGVTVEEGEIIPRKPYSYNASKLPSGIYYFQVSSDKKTYSYKFVVVH